MHRIVEGNAENLTPNYFAAGYLALEGALQSASRQNIPSGALVRVGICNLTCTFRRGTAPCCGHDAIRGGVGMLAPSVLLCPKTCVPRPLYSFTLLWGWRLDSETPAASTYNLREVSPSKPSTKLGNTFGSGHHSPFQIPTRALNGPDPGTYHSNALGSFVGRASKTVFSKAVRASFRRLDQKRRGMMRFMIERKGIGRALKKERARAHV